MQVARYKIILISGLLFFFLSCNHASRPFVLLAASQTNITFRNDLPAKEGLDILHFLYYYNGGGVATGDVNNDGLPDIYFTANSRGNNKLYLNKGNFKFEDISAKAGIAGSADWCSGVTMVDINGDGWLDIYVCAITGKFGLQGHNELFINNRDGSFSERSKEYRLDLASYASQAAFFDYDRDGDLDCYIVNQSDHPFQNIIDTGNRRKIDAKTGDRLYRNDLATNAGFTDVSAQAGIYQSNLGYGLGLGIADLNNDGWDDVYVGNDFHENDYYYVNNQNGTFTESGASHFNHYSRFSMGNDIADFNNDGQLDIVTADMLPPDEKVLKTYGSDENPDIYKYKISKNGFQHQYSKNCLQRNNGNGTSFSETGLISGIAATDWSWSPLFADFDNDGNKDLFISSGIVKRTTDLDYIRFVSNAYVLKQQGRSEKLEEKALDKMPDGSSHCFIFKGDGKLRFEDKSLDWGLGKDKGYFCGAAYADLDNDGDLDLVINNINAAATVYKNDLPTKNSLTINFKGDNLNSFGIGAKAYLFTGGKIQYQQLMLTRGFQSSSDPRLYFGLDTASHADSLLLVWPNQQFQLISPVPSLKTFTAEKKNASGLFDPAAWFHSNTPTLVAAKGNLTIDWQHQEDGFDDFSTQYLIPHALSTRGPKIAIGDVNNDGLDDFYACGAKGQPGTLFMQQKNGRFQSSDSLLFAADALNEDVDALFFDANGDGFADLYVVSGGNEYSGPVPALLDRLYINDGKGHFAKPAGTLPVFYGNKSCVSAADIDQDGDIDLFVGGLANAEAYGQLQTSYLLINDGKANYTLVPPAAISLADLGMVTTSAFSDINRDGKPDLIVAGEWMPLTVFINKGNSWVKNSIPYSTGLWQTIYIDDINADGYPDILAGNWGSNNKFNVGKDSPLRLYTGDFDNNGQADQLLSYTSAGIEYPFLAKDEVERALPLLKKHYLSYSEYAGVPMKEVFYGWIDNTVPLVAERLTSTVAYNDKKNGFILANLPDELQLAPIFSFQRLNIGSDGPARYIAGGNFFDVIPFEGRYDAQPLACFESHSDNTIVPMPQPALLQLKGQVRDLKWIGYSNRQKYLLVARNNEPLLVLNQTEIQ